MLSKLSVKMQMTCMLAGIVILLGVFSAVAWNAVVTLSSAANGMGQGKDIVADILPPPLYIIEAQLVVTQLHSGRADEVAPLIAKLESLKKDYDDRYAFWEKESLDADVKSSLFGGQRAAADAFWAVVFGDFLPAVRQGHLVRINETADVARQHYEKHREGVDQTVKMAASFADKTLLSLRESSSSAKQWVVVIAVGGLLFAAISIGLVLRETMRRLGGEPLSMQATARRIAAGDLTETIDVKAGDEASLLSSMAAMQSSLRTTISQSSVAADLLSNAARSLSTTSIQVSQGSAAQSEAAASMAASVEEVTVSIAHVAENADSARDLAVATDQLSHEGKELVHDAIEQIYKVAGSVTSTSEIIKSLGEKSRQISNIVNVIKKIADQTNLLALNAAIEAARAGEAGRGFSVVADEVHLLAERTAVSTKEIAQMIDAIQQEVASAVIGMDSGRKQADDSVAAALMAGESMFKIEESTKSLLVAVEDISSALHEQRTASTQIASNVELIAQMAEENSAAVNEVSSSANHLEVLAADLKQSVDRFVI